MRQPDKPRLTCQHSRRFKGLPLRSLRVEKAARHSSNEPTAANEDVDAPQVLCTERTGVQSDGPFQSAEEVPSTRARLNASAIGDARKTIVPRCPGIAARRFTTQEPIEFESSALTIANVCSNQSEVYFSIQIETVK